MSYKRKKLEELHSRIKYLEERCERRFADGIVVGHNEKIQELEDAHNYITNGCEVYKDESFPLIERIHDLALQIPLKKKAWWKFWG